VSTDIPFSHNDDDELLVRASAVLKSQGRRKLARHKCHALSHYHAALYIRIGGGVSVH
jgi:hypothetical protein